MTPFGIDLGTTNSVIARLRDGRADAIPIDGSPIVPSVVLYQGDEPIVGRRARNLALMHPGDTVRSVKRRMGQPHVYHVGGRDRTPEDVSADILRALRQGAEAFTGETVHDVVITVPAYFNDAQRRATLRAGELAGLNVLRLLNEPTAASLIYNQVKTDGVGQPEIILIYDLGGGTFDVSVLEVFEGVREVRATTGNSQLGGDDFDELLLRHFLDVLRRDFACDPREDARAMARLTALAEDTKIRLSSATEVRAREEFLLTVNGQPVHLDVTVSRREFEDLVRSLLESTITLARKAVEEAHLSEHEGGQRINRVCLVGGSTRIPLVRQLLETAFDAEIHEEVDPDLAVGLGAAVQSGLLLGAKVERLLVDVNAHSLGIRAVASDLEMDADHFAPVLRRNTALPAERTEEFYTMYDGQKEFLLEVFQGESARISRNAKVGEYLIHLEPRPGHSPVQVRFRYDLDGIVRVSVAQPGIDNEKTVTFHVADASKGGQMPSRGAAELDAHDHDHDHDHDEDLDEDLDDEAPLPMTATPAPASSAPQGAIERRAETLLAKLGDAQRARLAELLARYRATPREARASAEDALLDFLLGAEE